MILDNGLIACASEVPPYKHRSADSKVTIWKISLWRMNQLELCDIMLPLLIYQANEGKISTIIENI